jgi:hypothetical protein
VVRAGLGAGAVRLFPPPPESLNAYAIGASEQSFSRNMTDHSRAVP